MGLRRDLGVDLPRTRWATRLLVGRRGVSREDVVVVDCGACRGAEHGETRARQGSVARWWTEGRKGTTDVGDLADAPLTWSTFCWVAPRNGCESAGRRTSASSVCAQCSTDKTREEPSAIKVWARHQLDRASVDERAGEMAGRRRVGVEESPNQIAVWVFGGSQDFRLGRCTPPSPPTSLTFPLQPLPTFFSACRSASPAPSDDSSSVPQPVPPRLRSVDPSPPFRRHRHPSSQRPTRRSTLSIRPRPLPPVCPLCSLTPAR